MSKCDSLEVRKRAKARYGTTQIDGRNMTQDTRFAEPAKWSPQRQLLKATASKQPLTSRAPPSGNKSKSEEFYERTQPRRAPNRNAAEAR
jgi:hypothetical protein